SPPPHAVSETARTPAATAAAALVERRVREGVVGCSGDLRMRMILLVLRITAPFFVRVERRALSRALWSTAGVGGRQECVMCQVGDRDRVVTANTAAWCGSYRSDGTWVAATSRAARSNAVASSARSVGPLPSSQIGRASCRERV